MNLSDSPPEPPLLPLLSLPSVRRLLTLYVALCLMLCGLTAYALYLFRVQTLSNAQTELGNLAHVLTEQTRHAVQSADLLLQGTRGQVEDRLARRDGADPVVLHRLLQSRIRNIPQIRFLAITDARGTVIGHSLTENVGFSVADSSGYQALLTGKTTGLYVGEPRQSRVDGQWGIGLSYRLVDGEGHFAGVMSASFDPAYQQRIYQTIHLGEGSAITLLRADGVLLARWPAEPEAIGRSYAHGEVFTQTLKQASQGFLRSQSPVDGVIRLGYAQRIEGYPFVVTVSRAESAVLASWYRAVWLAALGVLMALTLLAMLTWRLARQARRQRQIELVSLTQAARLHAIDLASPVALLVADRDGACHYTNLVLTRLLAPDVAAGSIGNWLDQVDPADIEKVRQAWLQVFETGQDAELECRLRRGQDQPMWVKVHASPVCDANPVRLCVAAIDDISLRRERDALLNQTLTLQRGILDSTSYSIISTDVHGTIRSFNRGAERMLGYRSEEVVGRVTPRLIHDLQEIADRAAELSAELGRPVEPGFEVFVARARDGRPDEREWTYVRKDGSRVPVLLSVTPLRDEKGESYGYLGVAHDLTELHKALKIKRDFISIVSHELRTPLTSIRGALGLVASGIAGDLPERARELTQIALQNAERLVRLINDILDIEKLDSGRLRFDIRRHDLIPLLQRSLADNQGYASHYQVTLLLLSKLHEAWVEADADRLEQIMANLLSNAAKFSESGTTVEVTVVARGPCIRVEVADHGPGIAMAMRDQLFEKFSQIDASDARRRDGTGLGLAITRSLVEGMHGQLGVISEEGAGSRFWFELRRAAATPEIEDEAAASDGPARVLVLQPDIPDACSLAQQVLTAGFVPEISYRADEASRRWQSGRFQLLVMDPSAIAYDSATLQRLFPGHAGRSLCVASSWPTEVPAGCRWLVRPLAADDIALHLHQLGGLPPGPQHDELPA